MSGNDWPKQARDILAKAHSASFGTLNADGWPYVSLVSLAVSEEGRPLLLLSGLAWHSQNLLRDARASLLIRVEGPESDILAGTRLSIQGLMHKTDRPADRQSYLRAHNEAEIYANFADFDFWHMEPQEVHGIAGFGRIETFKGLELLNK